MNLTPPPDCQVVIVDRPGPDCARPWRVCIATACPQSLISAGTSRRSGSRCLRDYAEATQAEVAYALGLSPQEVARVEARALAKLRRAVTRAGLTVEDAR